jgi:CRP-like cAMP-binding protein
MYHNVQYESLGKNLLDLLNVDQKKRLIKKSKQYQISSGQTLFHMGDKADFFYQIISGEVKLFRLTCAGDEKVFNLFHQQDLIAEMSIFMPNPSYPMHAQATKNTTVLVISAKGFKDEFIDCPELSQKVISFMSMRVLNLVNQVDKLTFIKAEQRLVLHLAHLYLEQRSTDDTVKLPVSQRVLANQLSISAETLSRQFSRFIKLGLLVKLAENHYRLNVDLLCDAVELETSIFSSNPYSL